MIKPPMNLIGRRIDEEALQIPVRNSGLSATANSARRPKYRERWRLSMRMRALHDLSFHSEVAVHIWPEPAVGQTPATHDLCYTT